MAGYQISIASFLIGAGSVALVWLFAHLLAGQAELQRRLQVLEETARTRMPHEAKDLLHDALAVLSAWREQRDIDDTFAQAIVNLITRAEDVGTIRQGHK